MANITMTWDAPGGQRGTKKLTKNLQDLDDKIRKVITGEFIYHADEAVIYAKKNAPWTDQSGAARSGLNADAKYDIINQNRWELIVAHGVHYGIYLEVCNSGKYAIIMPTINHIGPLLLRRLGHAMDRIGASK